MLELLNSFLIKCEHGVRMRNSKLILLSHILPKDVIWVIDSFFPNRRKKVASPSLQKELKKIQTMNIRNLPAMYMRGLEDFCLD